MPEGLVTAPERGVYLHVRPCASSEEFNAALPVELVYVPSGEAPCSDADVLPRDRGKHYECSHCGGSGTRTIAPFYVGRYPVTWREFLAYKVALSPGVKRSSYFKLYGSDAAPGLSQVELNRPVFNVSHADAVAFTSWSGLRLPSAAEWKWAALGSERRQIFDPPYAAMLPRRHPWGNESPTPERCAASDPRYAGRSTAPVVERYVPATHEGVDAYAKDGSVALRPARPAGASWCGAQDMVGNVWQWVADNDNGIVGGSFRTHVNNLSGCMDADETVPSDHATDQIGLRVALSAS